MGVIGRFAILPLLSLALAGVAPAAVHPVAGDIGVRVRGVHAHPVADEGLSLDEAVARAERRHDARAVRAEAIREDGRTVYRIRLLSPDGRVFEVRVDARTGAFQ